MLSGLFSGLTTKAAIASGLVGILAIGVPGAITAWNVGHSAGYGKAEKRHAERERVAVMREATLYHELAASRLSLVELIDRIELVWAVTGEAQEKMRRELGRSRAEARAAADNAAKAIQQLARIEDEWKTQAIPDRVLRPFCVREQTRGCDPPPSAGAGGGDAVAVREPAAGDGGGVDR